MKQKLTPGKEVTEEELKREYFINRSFIAKVLRKHMTGPQAEQVMHRFWWYRGEDEEIDSERVMQDRAKGIKTSRASLRENRFDKQPIAV